MIRLLTTIACTMLLAEPAHAEAVELLCEPEARITFEKNWIRPSVVRLEARRSLQMPWTGEEPLLSAREIQSRLGATPEVDALPEPISFLAYRTTSAGLYIEQVLVQGADDQGLVIVDEPGELAHVLHCRSR